MVDFVIAAIILIMLVFAILRIKKHFKGGCCGSGSNTIRDKKTLTEPKLGEVILTVDGMSCENCAIRLENALNRLDGVLCKVNLKKKTATVSYSNNISDELLRETVEKLGFTVTEISR